MDGRRSEYERLCTTLREIRREKNISQTELANRLGWFQETVSRIELGERRLDVIEFLDWAQALSIDATDVFQRANLPHTASG